MKRFFASNFFKIFLCLSLLTVMNCTKKTKSLHLAIWSRYLGAHFTENFEKKTGIKLIVSHYSSNEELLAKLQAGALGYDVISPSDYMVSVMLKLNFLSELQIKALPNFKNIAPRFLRTKFDFKNVYSVPYSWGTTGIAINRDYFKGTIKTWKEFLSHPELKGKISILDDSREAFALAFKSLGYSVNSKNLDELEAAKKLMMSIRSNIKIFTSEPVVPITSGEVIACQMYSSDALYAKYVLNANIEYILPEEGFVYWVDNLAMSLHSKNIPDAHQLINYMLEPAIASETTKNVFLSPTVMGVLGYLPEHLKKNFVLFPSEEVLSKSETLQDLGSIITNFNQAWTVFKSS